MEVLWQHVQSFRVLLDWILFPVDCEVYSRWAFSFLEWKQHAIRFHPEPNLNFGVLSWNRSVWLFDEEEHNEQRLYNSQEVQYIKIKKRTILFVFCLFINSTTTKWNCPNVNIKKWFKKNHFVSRIHKSSHRNIDCCSKEKMMMMMMILNFWFIYNKGTEQYPQMHPQKRTHPSQVSVFYQREGSRYQQLLELIAYVLHFVRIDSTFLHLELKNKSFGIFLNDEKEHDNHLFRNMITVTYL